MESGSFPVPMQATSIRGPAHRGHEKILWPGTEIRVVSRVGTV